MGGVFGRVLYAMVLAGVLATATWVSFTRFVAGKSLKTPSFVTLTPDEAAARAAELGLAVQVDAAQEAFDDAVPAHRVRAQAPAADTAVKSGQTVRLFLSLGPRAVRMPDLTGLPARAATLALSKAGLKEAAVASVRLPGPTGVVAQGVSPGTIAGPDTPVDVLVNRGAPDVAWVMPDLIGRDFERVKTAFEERGFRIGGVRSQSYEGAATGTILRQFPLAGAPVTRRDALSFVIASPEAAP
ncbi:MAG TPA: PASTA domain-containing protein [Thermoanaerobaculia bacterium]|nr:PASTA domain-containing protein [Thermoanaerobaculia bacterium]